MCKLICCDLVQWIVGCINSIKFMNRRFRFELIHDHKLYRYKHCVVTMMNKSWHNVQEIALHGSSAAVWRNNGGKIKTSCLNIVKSGWNILSGSASSLCDTQEPDEMWHTEGAATAAPWFCSAAKIPTKHMAKMKILHQNRSNHTHISQTFLPRSFCKRSKPRLHLKAFYFRHVKDTYMDRLVTTI